ncbi:MAG: RNA polymerase-binding protein DksA [Rhodanobacteraceae bacterium]
MAKPKHGPARRNDKKVKPTAKSAKTKPARKAAAKPARKAPAKPVRKTAAKAVRKPVAKAAKATKTKATKSAKGAAKAVKKQKQTIKKTPKAPVVKKSAPKKPKPATSKPAAKTTAAVRNHAAPSNHAGHGAAHTSHPSSTHKPAHVRPTGGVAARLSVTAAAAEQTITREDGRYALPASVTIDLPKGYKPAAKEEYMNPKQLAYFRQKLKDWRDQLVEESRQTMENLREEVRDVGDDAERATRETENSLELRTRDRYRKLISKIEKALRKIEEGRYGYCEETDEEIGLERLEARPIATLSLDAQERREHLQKQMGD